MFASDIGAGDYDLAYLIVFRSKTIFRVFSEYYKLAVDKLEMENLWYVVLNLHVLFSIIPRVVLEKLKRDNLSAFLDRCYHG